MPMRLVVVVVMGFPFSGCQQVRGHAPAFLLALLKLRGCPRVLCPSPGKSCQGRRAPRLHKWLVIPALAVEPAGHFWHLAPHPAAVLCAHAQDGFADDKDRRQCAVAMQAHPFAPGRLLPLLHGVDLPAAQKGRPLGVPAAGGICLCRAVRAAFTGQVLRLPYRCRRGILPRQYTRADRTGRKCEP